MLLCMYIKIENRLLVTYLIICMCIYTHEYTNNYKLMLQCFITKTSILKLHILLNPTISYNIQLQTSQHTIIIPPAQITNKQDQFIINVWKYG